ncbi:hypothetical protein SVA_0513 [Sulfurifustis variabilis]|uniref:Uncharacterized protein n=1 Tax=Sulfurifustis variabilis TaxID=1675686 RepID=A0A1B4V718_9GAMM|nr:hypothetical protein [Sulfurifustis variabilis]BAU47094.1 hypothetical protein SVA_0513 [Sulfurifustis variabilis]
MRQLQDDRQRVDHEKAIPRCAGCYHDAITLLEDDTRRVNCPKCGESARLTPRDGEWQ